MKSKLYEKSLTIFLSILLVFVVCKIAYSADKSDSPNLSSKDTKAPFISTTDMRRQEYAEINKKLDDLAEDIGKKTEVTHSTWWEKLLPAGIGIVGILIASGLSGWLGRAQLVAAKRALHSQIESAQDAQRTNAGNDAMTRVMEFRSKQLNEFYFPILLMFSRSTAVRKQLCDMLKNATSGVEKFYDIKDDEGIHLWVKEENKPDRPFRLIHDMYDLAKNYPEVMPLVKEIVNIGEQISKLIYEKGGYVKIHETKEVNAKNKENNEKVVATANETESNIQDEISELSSKLGTYLGHYSILKDAYSIARKDPEQLKKITYTILYPRDLIKLLRNDAKSLISEIDNWGKAAQDALSKSAIKNNSV